MGLGTHIVPFYFRVEEREDLEILLAVVRERLEE